MAGFHLYTSNDQLRLVTVLGEVLKANRPAHIFEPERIVIQSLGMKRWISLRLAEQLGILAHTRFLFPNQLLNEIFQRVVTPYPEADLFDRDMVAWKIMDLLPGELQHEAFRDLKHYLLEDGQLSQIRAFQLARKIAYLFDQYCMYRPEMIMDWDSGEKDGWQSDLWRSLRNNGLKIHLPALRKAFFERMADGMSHTGPFPERITVFGITSLPPLHIEVLAALSHVIDIHLYFLNPSRKYWGDIMSQTEMARGMKRQKDLSLTEEMLHMEEGNPLLASFGRTGRSFFQLLLAGDFDRVQEQEFFCEPAESHLLGLIQSDMFHLVNRSGEGGLQPETRGDDRSLQIHACHSRMREIEVLHDQLQLLMSRNPALKPGEILVMAPDINLYAPLIKAVFTGAGERTPRLPFSIADRNYYQESRVIQWFLKLLALSGSRFRISEILDLLEAEAILTRYDLRSSDVTLLQDWLASVNIRWGIDQAHKEAAGTPRIHQNTWEFGLDRLLLGLAMPDEGIPYQGILPFDRIEGSQGILLGKFLCLFSDLRSLVQSAQGNDGSDKADRGSLLLDKPRSLNEWKDYLNRMVGTFFAEQEAWDDELQVLRDVFHGLTKIQAQSGFTRKVDFEVIHDYLSQELEQGATGFGFLGAGITFCSMLPMRSIPFRVVALLGLNEQSFPRQSQPLSFDRMAMHPRLGDRSIKEDDRYLFLEAIISARDTLYISYIGQSIKDNSTIPPSALVSELIQYLEAMGGKGENSLPGQVITRHPLQAFNPTYFAGDTRLTSFSGDNLDAARILLKGASRKQAPFISEIPEPDDRWKTVTIEQLVSFFDNPCRYLLKQRLGLSLADESDVVEETEPFQLSGLDKYALDQMLVDSQLLNHPPEAVLGYIQATGVLPPETVGRVFFNQEQESATRFVEILKPYLEKAPLSPLAVDLALGRFQIQGKIDPVRPAGLIRYRFARIKTKDRIASWLEWLLFNHLVPDTGARQSILVGLNQTGAIQILTANPVENPETHLNALLEIYWAGLRRPLPFFPQSSAAYVEALTGKTPEKAMSQALKKWVGSDLYGEQDDPAFARCFGHTQPLNDAFAAVSRSILMPVFSHYDEKR
ncbi:MAG: exodeoxyribonuclease V subunit gamma [bacterium]